MTIRNGVVKNSTNFTYLESPSTLTWLPSIWEREKGTKHWNKHCECLPGTSNWGSNCGRNFNYVERLIHRWRNWSETSLMNLKFVFFVINFSTNVCIFGTGVISLVPLQPWFPFSWKGNQLIGILRQTGDSFNFFKNKTHKKITKLNIQKSKIKFEKHWKKMNESFKEKIFEQFFATSKLQNSWLGFFPKKFSDEKFRVLVSSLLNPFFQW